MPLVLGGSSGPAVAFAVDNSCRFNAADSAYLKRDQGTPTGTGTKATVSLWFKMGLIASADRGLFVIKDTSSTSLFQCYFWEQKLQFDLNDSASYHGRLITNRLIRDVGAWYHLVFVLDTTQGTEANRMKIYVNGTLETSLHTATYPAEDAVNGALAGTSGYDQQIAAYTFGGGSYFDGYIAEACFIDGTAYAASDFGEFDGDSPTIWKPKAVSGLTFGDQGFYCDFEDSAELGDDKSGNTNDLTEYNLAAVDQATDTPTNNFATLNLLDNYYAGSTFTQGNCQAAFVASPVYGVNTSTIGVTTGKWYFEAVYTTSNDSVIGITDNPQLSASAELGDTAYAWSIYGNGSTTLLRNNDAQVSWGAAFAQGDIVGVAIDMDNLRLYFANANTWMNSADPTDGTGAIDITTSTGIMYPAVGVYGGSSVWQLNFGGCPVFAISSAATDGNDYGAFEYAPPSGYLALCTKNLGSDGG